MAAAQVAALCGAGRRGHGARRRGHRQRPTLILDVRGLRITDPLAMEAEINQWPGVVTVGIFARHRAHTCLLGTAQGVQTLVF